MNTRVRQWLLIALSMWASIFSMAPAGAASTNGEVRVWSFRALLDGSDIGYHRFTLTQHGEERTLNSEARFKVKLWFINAYHYVHNATEHWRGECLNTMTSDTDDNGKKYIVNTTRNGDVLDVAIGATRYSAGGCMMTFAYWNPLMLKQSKLLNAQTGENMPVVIKELPHQSIDVKGQTFDAARYQLIGKELDITLWYSAAGDWLALESKTPTGHKLSYRLE